MIEISHILEVKAHMEGLRAVIFDLDDTLYSEKEYVRSGYRKVAEILPEIEHAEEKLWKLFEEKKPAIDELLRREHMESDEKKQACLNVYRLQMPDIHLYDGVVQMLRELKNQGLRLGIITDGRPEGQRAKLQALGLETLVDQIIVTDELGGSEYRKPCPLAFQRMQEKMGIEFKEMCYVGDNIAKDFIAPDRLGMRSIWFKNPDGIYISS